MTDHTCYAGRFDTMGDRTTLWTRWRRIAQRAAEAQAHVLFFLLYFLAIVPMGLLRLGGPSELTRRSRGHTPRWRDHESPPADLGSSRRQF
jgi:hypothetical protein